MISTKLFNRLFPTKGLNPRKFNLVRRRDELITALNKFLPKYGINTRLRVIAALACWGIETDYFKTTIEYADGWAYDISVNPRKARELGNTSKGDGPRYKGSGLTQTTGKFNFIEVDKVIGRTLGIDVVEHPEILRENIEVAVESACIFWDKNKLNRLADRNEFKQLSAIVNRGDKNKTPLHWEKRKDLYDVLTVVIPNDFSITTVTVQPVVLTPTGLPMTPATMTDSTTTAAAPTAEAEKSKVKEFSEKYLKHCPQDTVKNVCGVVAARAAASLTTVWSFGLHGKILLIIAGLSLLGFSAYALYFYLPRITGWFKDIADPLMPSE